MTNFENQIVIGNWLQLLNARHYKPRFVYFYLIFQCGWYYRQFVYVLE